MLRERVRSALEPFKNHMDLDGAALRQTERRMTSIFDIARSVLKDPDVAAVFTIRAPINKDWPLGLTDPQGARDPEGARLIQEITTQLKDLPYGVISREMFVHIQRIADKGFESIRIIVDTPNIRDPGFDIDPLISELYAWGSDLKLVGGARRQEMSASMPPPPP